MTATMGFLGGLALTVLGIVLLRRVWASATAPRWHALPGWALIAAGFAGWVAVADADKAVVIGFLAFSLVGYGVVILGRDRRRRPHRAPKAPVAMPVEPGRRAWIVFLRGAARTLLAGPLAAATGMSVAALVAVRAGGMEADRLVAAGFIGPIGWGIAMTWALVDARLARVGLLLPLTAGAAVAAAWLSRV
ncbi:MULTISPECIES: hypothetical protein [Nitrospirillum]|uniref:Uncharacterized protein n=1 Tax=Nitrospirillum amazonense TaxID=28077 RepID=A0A560GA68_9PROT|nr:hypothetical protein [Nitrospirillum amazonense]MEC4595255.1 hypothetical protein [Nitrospirillum amazonense]TWB30808.1 hypothetical protein FBZ88_102373 [Nitrospirillum amazonense]